MSINNTKPSSNETDPVVKILKWILELRKKLENVFNACMYEKLVVCAMIKKRRNLCFETKKLLLRFEMLMLGKTTKKKFMFNQLFSTINL